MIRGLPALGPHLFPRCQAALCGLERRASGGILAPILTHITWSLSMLFLLPLLF